MPKSIGMKALMAYHEKQVVASVTKHLNNQHWQTNPNSICWVYEEPRYQKQFGRAARIYNRMRALHDLD